MNKGVKKMRLDALPDASRRIEGFVKAHFIKHQGLFQKALQTKNNAKQSNLLVHQRYTITLP